MNILNLATRDNFSALASSLHEGLLRALLLRFGLSNSNKGILKRVLLLRFGAVSPAQVINRRRHFIWVIERARQLSLILRAGSSSSGSKQFEKAAPSTLVRQ
jgi:hypothetical protein